jgi:2-polyprenyl-3-methyl-5-hydroxy-6-metoxy-1,4-benzoquinol methylase
MAFDYEAETRKHYQDDAAAADYHEAFAKRRDWRAWRFLLVAARERAAVGALLDRVPHGTVLDLPAGTGKLAPLLAPRGARVTACDLSPNMLAIARREYATAGLADARFEVCDAERIGATLSERFDVAVCLRLMHRVPAEVRCGILRELAAVAGHTIVSFGIETPWHAARRRIRQGLFGGGADRLCYAPLADIRAELAEHFELIEARGILPLLSQEWLFLLRPKRKA